MQSNRKDFSSLRETENSLRDEVTSVQIEASSVIALVESKRAEHARIIGGLQEKQSQVDFLTKQLEELKRKLANEKLGTGSKGQLMETIVKTLASHEKEVQQADKNVGDLKKTVYKDSKRLADLRKHEMNLIVQIRGIMASIKDYSSKANILEKKYAGQQELLSNAKFQLQQMEKKIARGRGERSDEEQQELQNQIKSLEESLASKSQKKLILVQQKKKLQVELRTWDKKYKLSESKHGETLKMIDSVGMQIFACGQKLKDLVATKEEAMVLHNVTVIDVRRLRDSLRNLLEEVYSLRDQAAMSSSSMQEKKKEIIKLQERKLAQLRISKEARHKSAVELGKVKAGLEKTKAKYNTISEVNARKGEGEGFETPELKLILAAQRREELQREGDTIDKTIQLKENEIRMMQQTLTQLRGINNNLRCSFTRADVNCVKAQELKELEKKIQTTEGSLIRVRKELQMLQKASAVDRLELERITGKAARLEK